MDSEAFQSYRHSGKYRVSGPLLTLLATLLIGFPLGIAYAFLVKWIPLIYVTFFATVGYGFLFGWLGLWILKYCKVRNNAIALLTGALSGLIAWYWSWNGEMRAIFTEAPWLCLPDEIFHGMKLLYENGSWGLHGGDPLTGIPLAIVWAVEAVIIIGMAAVTCYGGIKSTPYCETSQCWLDQEKKISTLAPFTDPDALAKFKAGDLSPLTTAKPRSWDDPDFTRVILKHSPRCEIFCTVQLQSVNVRVVKHGKTKETTRDLSHTLVLPRSMLDLIAKFEGFAPPEAPVTTRT